VIGCHCSEEQARCVVEGYIIYNKNISYIIIRWLKSDYLNTTKPKSVF